MSTIHVGVWSDPLVEARGHHITSEYVEYEWLPTIGPLTLFLARRLVHTAANDDPRVDIDELAISLGVPGPQSSHNRPIPRALRRLETFGIATSIRPGHIAVRTHLPDLPQRHANRIASLRRSRRIAAQEASAS